MNSTLTLYYIAGPIGAGKTSFASVLISACGLADIEFISADLYYYLYFMHDAGSLMENYEKAKAYRDYKLHKALAHNQSFIWESVLGEEKIQFLRFCRERGYSLVGLFVGTEDYTVLLKRVEKRRLEGWYDVPESKVISRYYTMMEGLQSLFELSDTFLVVDSADEQARLVCYKNGTNVEYLAESCTWLGGHLQVDGVK